MQIKQTLQEKEGIEIPMIRLIFGGKQLADENKISDYNLEAGSTIHMVLQLRGGFWMLENWKETGKARCRARLRKN